MKVPKTVAKRTGILLDLGCRDRKEPNWVGIDGVKRPGVDIVHDLEKFPYPIQSGSCLTIKAAHVAEHINPRLFFKWMDEMWRMLKVGGQFVLSAPYAGSLGFWHDPTHVCHITEVTFQFLDPDFPLYQQYKPRPWNIEHAAWMPNGNVEAILRKRAEQDEDMVLAQESLQKGALQKITELAPFYALIRKKSLGVVVEIGTSHGGVFYGLCKLANRNATIVSIDMPAGKFGGVIWSDDSGIRGYGRPGQRLEFIRFDSHKASTKAKLCNILGGSSPTIDLLFIDGDHTYKGVKQDYEMYSPLVKKGGMIVFHDICDHPAMLDVEVMKYWKEVKRGKKTVEFIDLKDKTWGGIGVILK
jgi:predicted O-methyltransferase YrrM